MLRSLAVFLPFVDSDLPLPLPSLPVAGYHSSFLSLARTCKRAYEVLTSDAQCWSTQQLRFDCTDPLLEDCDFVPRYDAGKGRKRFVLLVDRFTARRQAILRSLLGADVFDRLITPLMANTRTVRLSYHCAKDGYYGVKRGEDGIAAAKVYPDFNVRVLADPEIRRLPNCNWPRDDQCWVRGCYSFALLPPCTRLTSAATVMLPSCPFTLQTSLNVSSLSHLMRRLPAVECLTLQLRARISEGRPAQLPEWGWDALRLAAPRLRALKLVDVMAGWNSVTRPLLTSELGALQELVIDSHGTFVFRTGDDSLFVNERQTFRFPPLTDQSTAAATNTTTTTTTTTAATAAAAEEEPAVEGVQAIDAVQLQLRLALCRYMIGHLCSDVLPRVPSNSESWQRLLAEFSTIETELTAQQRAQQTSVDGQPTAKRARLEHTAGW